MPNFTVARLLALAALSLPTQAQTFTFTGTQPAAQAVAVPRRNAVAAATSGPVANPPAAGSLRVFSSQRSGRLGGTLTASGSTVSFAPTQAFQPGELLNATATRALLSATGAAPAAARVWQFEAAAFGGTGRLAGGADFQTGGSGWGVAAGDIDNDGNLDLLFGDDYGGRVAVYRNTPSGFALASYVSTGPSVRLLALGDLDGDGDLDLVVANSNVLGPTGTVSVRFNNGTGTFTGSVNLPAGDQPWGVALGDLDGDGDLDLVSTSTFPGTALVRFNNGAGTFGAATVVATDDSPLGVYLRDLDNDGDLDMATANFNVSVSLRFNNGAGAFSGTTNLPVSNSMRGLAFDDTDRDGDLDLYTVGDNQPGIQRYANNGSGGFTYVSTIPYVDPLFDVCAADVNGDGYNDLLGLTSGSVRPFLATGSNGFAAGVSSTGGLFSPRTLAAADFDGDGDLDVATTNATNYLGAVRINNGRGPALALGAARSAETHALRLAPVPAASGGWIHVEALPAGTPAVLLLDGLGRELRRVAVPVGATALELPLRGLAPGHYILRAGAASRRLVVE